jgi:predicted nucleic acid-binding protein
MRILIDADVLLDVALKREEFFVASKAVVDWAEDAPGQAAVAWHSLSNIVYMTKTSGREFLRDLLEFIEVPNVGTDDAKRAFGFPMNDLEDALQAASALAFNAAFLVTRNLEHYRKSPVSALSPSQFLAKAKQR